MQLRISREEILKPLSHVAGVVERRQTLPILSNILLRIEGDRLSMVGTDLEIEVATELSISNCEEGEITLPARKLLDICRALPTEAMLEIKVVNEKVTVQSGKSRFSLLTLPTTDFPNLETSEWQYELSLPQADLKALFERTQFSMAQQDVRYYLNGLLLEIEAETMRAVATDGHRMALSTLAISGGQSENKQIIVPKKGVHELARFLEDSAEPVIVKINPNHIRAELNSLIFTSKLIDGRFPDYTKVIPENQSKSLMLNREQFKQSLNRAAILSNEKYRGIRFTLTQGMLTITAHNPDHEEAQEEIEVDYSDEDMEIGFNSSYIIEAVSALPTDTVELGLHDANSSGTLRSPGDHQTQYVVMPMRL